ncbi:MAG: alpha/beta hydrolase [Gemmatimonadota bacterium]
MGPHAGNDEHLPFAVEIRGEGDPLVLVHGSASDARTWRSQRQPFAERFRVITYSRRYHWPNPSVPAGSVYSMAEQVADLEAVLATQVDGPAHLVGHSYGAVLCLLAALRRPDRVRTLVLEEPPAFTLFVSDPPKPLEVLRLLVTRPRTGVALARFGAGGLAPAVRALERGEIDRGIRTFGDTVFGAGGYERLSAAQKQQVSDNRDTTVAELLGPGFLPIPPEQLQTLAVPTLLMGGSDSIPLLSRILDRLQGLLPDVTRQTFTGANHLVHEDKAADYNEAVLSFLAARG